MGQLCALLWPFMRSHRVLSDTRRCCPKEGVNVYNVTDTINATSCGGIDVPHECLSAAKIGINSETTKFFGENFLLNEKRRDADPENLRPKTY